MKRQLQAITLLVLPLLAVAQDEAIFNHYVQNPIIINPAAAGFGDEYTAQLNARAQWSGFEDSPKTVGFRLNGPIGNSFGIGAGVFTESAAQLNRLKGQLDVAFRFGFGPTRRSVPAFRAAFGFFAQFQRLTLDGSVVGSPQYDPGDDTLTEFLDGKNEFDAGIGVYGSYLEQTFGGLTINNLVANRLENISGSDVENEFNFTFLLGQRIRLDGANVNITPSIMVRNIADAPAMFDFNLQAGFLDDQFITGLTYHSLGSVGLLLGTELQGFQLYYSFDLGFGGLQTYSNGSHELTVGYSIARDDILSSRWRKVTQPRR